MPLIILCGTPCSGKSYCSQYLKDYFEKKDKNIVLISDENYFESNKRNQVFKDSSKEKQMRGYLKSAVQRNLLSDNLVILDSSNYIKGFRYELYCLAKEHKTTHCVFQCIEHKEIALERNNKRQSDQQYSEEIFLALIQRYEDPLPNNRWDSPLFNYINDKLDDICNQIDQSLFQGKPNKANQSTISIVTSDNDFLQTVNAKTKEVIDKIVITQEIGELKGIQIDGSKLKVNLKRKLTSLELSKLKRQFINFIKTHPVDKEQITNSFVQYINVNCVS